MMCGVRLVDRVSTDVLCDKVGLVVKIDNIIVGMVMPCMET